MYIVPQINLFSEHDLGLYRKYAVIFQFWKALGHFSGPHHKLNIIILGCKQSLYRVN